MVLLAFLGLCEVVALILVAPIGRSLRPNCQWRYRGLSRQGPRVGLAEDLDWIARPRTRGNLDFAVNSICISIRPPSLDDEALDGLQKRNVNVTRNGITFVTARKGLASMMLIVAYCPRYSRQWSGWPKLQLWLPSFKS